MTEFEPVIGRYLSLEIEGALYRVYVETAGQGIPLLLQHTAGSDNRQWRHLLNDPEIGARFAMVAADLPGCDKLAVILAGRIAAVGEPGGLLAAEGRVALVEAGVLAGLPRAVASTLAIETVLGTATMLAEGDLGPEALRASVTSPGGTTAAGLRVLEQRAVRAAFLDAVMAATERAAELGG